MHIHTGRAAKQADASAASAAVRMLASLVDAHAHSLAPHGYRLTRGLKATNAMNDHDAVICSLATVLTKATRHKDVFFF